jgi:hypothetical protein
VFLCSHWVAVLCDREITIVQKVPLTKHARKSEIQLEAILKMLFGCDVLDAWQNVDLLVQL